MSSEKVIDVDEDWKALGYPSIHAYALDKVVEIYKSIPPDPERAKAFEEKYKREREETRKKLEEYKKNMKVTYVKTQEEWRKVRAEGKYNVILFADSDDEDNNM